MIKHEISDEMNCPSDSDVSVSTEVKQKVLKNTLESGTDDQKTTIIQHFFKTMEQLNISQVILMKIR